MVNKVCKKAKENCLYVQNLSSSDKNKMLKIMSDAIKNNSEYIIEQNLIDLNNNQDKPKHIIDRLTLNKDRIYNIAKGLDELTLLENPIGEIIEEWVAPNGMQIKKVRVPLGVLAIIYEARPNVTIDAIGLALKSGNAIVLRGSRDAICSNKALVAVVKGELARASYNPEFIQLVEDTARNSAEQLMRCREYVDVLIPRGSAGLIKTVIEKSLIPVIETGAGNCHAYVHESCDIEMAKNIIINAKTQRPGVCNSIEKVLIDEKIAESFLPFIAKELTKYNVELLGCDKSVKFLPSLKKATSEDFYEEFLDLKIAFKIISGGVIVAVEFINEHSTSHSDVIITNDAKAAECFLNAVDSAVVYWNVSTRFTDGFEFGFGAEMGISTQKIHARGPIGLKQLTCEKYVITGEGQVRK